METIVLNNQWRYHIAPLSEALHSPEINDQDWDPIQYNHNVSGNLGCWLRYHFDMQPNDECSVWWIELKQTLPEGASIWVNYEQIELVDARCDVTYAIAMEDNVVTIFLPAHTIYEPHEMQIVPYPCT